MIGGTPRKFLEDGILGSVAPDGSTVAFTRNTGRVGDREVWFIGADGSNARKFLDVGEDTAVQEPWWSPDGQRIVYYTQRQLSDRLEVKVETRDLKGDAPAVIYSEFAATPEKSKLRDFNWLTAGSMVMSLAEPDSDLVNTFTVRCNLWELPIDSRSGRAAGAMKRLTNLPVGADVTYLYPTADGKRISVLRMLGSISVYLADFDAGGRHISSPDRLTATDGWNNAPAWDRDSRCDFLRIESRRAPADFQAGDRRRYGGAGGERDGRGERAGGESGWCVSFVCDADSLDGGRLGDAGAGLCACREREGRRSRFCPRTWWIRRDARGGRVVCVRLRIRRRIGHTVIFTAFDVLHGRGRELARIDADPNADYGWDLSPDGTEIAYIKRVPRSDGKIFSSEGPIHVLSLNGALPREIQVKGMNEFREYVDWAANGKGLILAHPTETDAELIYVDMAGNANVLWRQKGAAAVRGVSSPDGRHLAILCGGAYNNVWMMENF